MEMALIINNSSTLVYDSGTLDTGCFQIPQQTLIKPINCGLLVEFWKRQPHKMKMQQGPMPSLSPAYFLLQLAELAMRVFSPFGAGCPTEVSSNVDQ